MISSSQVIERMLYIFMQNDLKAVAVFISRHLPAARA